MDVLKHESENAVEYDCEHVITTILPIERSKRHTPENAVENAITTTMPIGNSIWHATAPAITDKRHPMRLSQKQKTSIYYLRYEEHETTQNIALMLGIPEEDVSRVLHKDRKHRALESKTRTYLKKEMI